MTVETRLRSAMADAIAPVVADADHLVAVARRRGLAIRRRRQALSTLGVAAAISAIALAPTLVAGDIEDRDVAPATVPVGSVPRSFDQSPTAPVDGRSTTAALLYAVGLETTGTATGFRGTLMHGRILHAAGEFTFTPEGSKAPGLVNIDIQFDPANARSDGQAKSTPCVRDLDTQCHASRLADGSVLQTSLQIEDHRMLGGNALVRKVVLDRPDGLTLTVEATNGLEFNEPDARVTRGRPVLSTDQLEAVALQKWWGKRLPTYFTATGASLDPFIVPQEWLTK